MFKTKKNLYSRKRFSCTCQISYQEYYNLKETIRKKIKTLIN